MCVKQYLFQHLGIHLLLRIEFMKRKRVCMKNWVFIAATIYMSTVFLPTAAQGATIPLSSHTSDEPRVPASWLDASMDLSVANIGYWELTLAVTNKTPETASDLAFKMSKLYFNTSASITDMMLNTVTGGNKDNWVLKFDMDNISVDGFGLFDISLVRTNPSVEWIGPQETVTFKILINAGTPPYSDADFFTLSYQHDGHNPAYGAAKFFGGGPDDLSAFGAYLPEPATMFLLGFGALTLLRKRRV